MIWTLDDIKTVTNGTMTEHIASHHGISGIEFDSRRVQSGDLFLAFKGAHADGHDHLDGAREKGAVAALVDHQTDASITQIVVPDVQAGLWDMAKAARARTDAKIVAITGSVGKTGTRDLMATCLGTMGKTHATAGNYNNHIGAPLSLARMPQDTDYGVFELGMDHAGEIAALSPLVQPDIAVITKIAASHIGFFDSIDGIAEAKAEIFDGLKSGGLAILNADDDFASLLAKRAQEKGADRVMTVGTHGDADTRIEKIEATENGYIVSATIDGTALTFTLGMSAVHWIWSALMGLTAVSYFGGDLERAAERLAQHRELDGRGARHKLTVNGADITLIDDSYNASPASMAAGIANLGATNPAENGRKIAMLADMLELGDDAEQYHRNIADDLIKSGIDIVICFGPLMAGLADEVSAKHRNTMAIYHCADADTAITIVLELLNDHDVVLVKGSNGMKAHHVAKTLKSLSQNDGDHHAA